MDLHSILVQCAHEEGFPLAAGVDIDLAQDHFSAHIEKYDRWLNAGFSGAMEYLKRGRDRRADPRLLFPEAQSIFCVAIPYPTQAAGNADGVQYARYIRGGDYHRILAEKLQRVLTRARAQWGDTLQWKICVDTSAVLERTWAALAGLGWIGKNTLLIHPQLGSYLFLAEALINVKMDRAPSPLPSYCGNCSRCLEACPVGALSDAGLNATQCTSYWTLEKRGALEISEAQKQKIGKWVAGCDLCQEACPFNRKPSKRSEFVAQDPVTDLASWVELLQESQDQYRNRVSDSALKRVKPAQFSRNLAIALANEIQNRNDREFSQSLQPWIKLRLNQESDPAAQAEWNRCLSFTHQT